MATKKKQEQGGNYPPFWLFLVILALALAFIPAVGIPWSKTVWTGAYYVKVPNELSMRILKVALYVISGVTWLGIFYIKYLGVMNDNDKKP
ncbi:MAG: hypothetical protein J5965_14375 [Aeriscardovia sp.]|nr:hypothetical protein [Aeriscardovia sp.]